MDSLELENPFDDEVTELFRSLVQLRLSEGESLDDVMAGGVSLAAERARLLDRQPYPIDGEFAFSLCCWWPLKPKVPEELESAVQDLRRYAFEGVSQGDLTRLANVLPADTLTLPFEELYARQAAGDLASLFPDATASSSG